MCFNFNNSVRKNNREYREIVENNPYFQDRDYMLDQNYENYYDPYRPNNNYFPRYNYPEYPNYSRRNVSLNTIQMRNNMLKNSYPKIYSDINLIIDDYFKENNSFNFTEEEIENVLNIVEERYKKKEEDAKDKNQNNNLKGNLSNNLNNELLKDLIKIILITRLIKLNFDNLPVNRGSRYDASLYENMQNYYINDDKYKIPESAKFMGYLPRNYF